jgi:AraC-like DNA-binding protein
MASIMGLRVQGVGHLVKESGWLAQVKPRTLQAFALVYLVNGSGIFESAPTGRVEIGTGTVFVLFPGVQHRYGPRENDQWREYWTIFEGFIPDRYRAAGLLDPVRPFFHLEQDADLERRWKECLFLAETAGSGQCRALAERTFALLGHIFFYTQVKPAEQNRARHLVESVAKLLEKYLDDPDFRLEEHAAHFALSYSALRHNFTAATGISPAAYLAKMRMQRAQARLLSNDEPIKRIAVENGFLDPYHFSRRFKQLVGLSPERFRKEFQVHRPNKLGPSKTNSSPFRLE